MDKQAELEATEKAVESLLVHGVVEDMKCEAVNFKFLTALWEKEWRVKNGEWKNEGTICGSREQVARAQRICVSPGCNTYSWTCDRLHSFDVGLGDVRNRCCGNVLPRS